MLRDRIIMIGTPIDDEVANVIVAQLLFLQSEDPKAGISLYLNSPGGSVAASLAIRDTMEYVQLPITTLCMRQCHGTAALLLACGTRGLRFSQPQARIGLVPFEMKAGLEDDPRTRHTIDGIIGLFADHTGQTRKTVREDLTHGREFTPEGAIAYGLIDSVMER
jgi:ATP-dependent Clp protease protease subunit